MIYPRRVTRGAGCHGARLRLLACIAAAACVGERDTPLRNIKEGYYPHDSVLTVSGVLSFRPDAYIPFTKTSVRALVDRGDTIRILVPDTVRPGWVRLRVRVYEAGLLAFSLGRALVAVEDSAARTSLNATH